ncbi:MAG: hypothetical protein RJA70_1333 [Pseudomonadota bacterium]|jgi:uncharacterized membrane protein
MQVVALGTVVTLLVYAVWVWPDLPARVPTHFGISGAPDGWGSRAWLLALPTLATLLFLGLTFLERVPHLYNYPIEVTASNAPLVYALGRQLVLALKLIVVVAFGLVFRTSVEVALGRAAALPGGFFPIIVGSTAAVFVITLVRVAATGRTAELRLQQTGGEQPPGPSLPRGD